MKSSESKYARCLYFTTNSLARQVEKLAIVSWKPVDLSPSHAYLLMLVIDEPGLQPGMLADHLQLTPSTITRLIERLEEKKLVVRTVDGKVTNVYPTPKAKQLSHTLEKCTQHFYKAIGNVLTKEDSHKILSGMHSLSDKLNS